MTTKKISELPVHEGAITNDDVLLVTNPNAPEGSKSKQIQASSLGSGLSVGAMIESVVDMGEGWLLCDESSYLNSAYPELSAILGQQQQLGEWNLYTSIPSSYEWSKVVWSPKLSLFVAMGQNDWNGASAMASSVDGINWTKRSSPHSDGTGLFKDMVWSDHHEMFIVNRHSQLNIGGDGDMVNISYDGINWISSYIPNADSYLYHICVSEVLGKFIITGQQYGTKSDKYYLSDDGINWTVYNFGTTGVAGNIGWMGGTTQKFIYALVSQTQGDATSSIKSSSDGINWADVYPPNGHQTCISMCFSEELDCMLILTTDPTGRITYSEDGINWTKHQTSDDTMEWDEIIWVKEMSKFYAVGHTTGGQRFMSSSDGKNWVSEDSANNSQNWYGIVFSPELMRLVTLSQVNVGAYRDAFGDENSFVVPNKQDTYIKAL